MAIEGDLRFASHHDVMRAVERTVRRAKLPIRYSQGFNPRPVLSLPCPRPVGVASRDDLLVMTLDDQAGGLSEGEWIEDLRRSAPEGLTLSSPRRVESKRTPAPERIRYELSLTESQKPCVRQRVSELADRDSWPVERVSHGRRGRKRTSSKCRTLDLRPLVERIEVVGDALVMVLVPLQQRWAKPGEVLELVGLDGRVDLARLRRVNVKYSF
jgi:radical SAM-linked protein